jgi:hypothetical protein
MRVMGVMKVVAVLVVPGSAQVAVGDRQAKLSGFGSVACIFAQRATCTFAIEKKLLLWDTMDLQLPQR